MSINCLDTQGDRFLHEIIDKKGSLINITCEVMKIDKYISVKKYLLIGVAIDNMGLIGTERIEINRKRLWFARLQGSSM